MTQSNTITSAAPEMAHEFERLTEELLRRRFLWFSGLGAIVQFGSVLINAAIGLGGLSLLYLLFGAGGSESRTVSRIKVLSLLVGVLVLVCYSSCFLAVRKKVLTRERLLGLTYLLVVCDGILRVGSSFLPGSPSMGLPVFAITHILACSFLPWSPRQAAQPLIPVLGIFAVLELIAGEGGIEWRIIAILLSPAVGLPGWFICTFRHSRRVETFERAFLYKRYKEVRRELYDARRIHESLFPRPLTEGPVQFHYRYEPMQLIGGDYLFATSDPATGKLSLVLLDVTGHGIIAALTVNRIAGELQRIFAEEPDAGPGPVLRLLNRYAHLTLASHSVYLTALCARVDPNLNVLEFASGGHPPAYIRAADGKVHELIATSFVLGACADEDFVPGGDTRPFHVGDVFVAYTDGVIEARSQTGRMFGLSGIRRVMHAADSGTAGSWAQTIMEHVERHRYGPTADDVLVAEVARVSASAPKTSTSTGKARIYERPTPVEVR